MKPTVVATYNLEDLVGWFGKDDRRAADSETLVASIISNTLKDDRVTVEVTRDKDYTIQKDSSAHLILEKQTQNFGNR